MKINRLVIENFKSIQLIDLDKPNPFTVFVGPNGSGKSTIFEALEFHIPTTDLAEKMRLFGGRNTLQNRLIDSVKFFEFAISSETFVKARSSSYWSLEELDPNQVLIELGIPTSGDFNHEKNEKNYLQFARSFSRLFIGNTDLQKQNYIDDSRLTLSTRMLNLEKVLRRILQNQTTKAEIFEWLDLFVPGFKAVEVDDRNELHWFEDSVPDYFTKDLISDGTYNILALLTAVYQSDEPQFLCIEEPENGLHPEVILSLIAFFRKQCEEKGHYIWLNTHSETVVRLLTTDEIVLVNKRQGATEIKQVKGMNTYSLTTDEAWLTGALGGGLTW